MKTKKLVLTALFIALSFIGANIKIEGSIAFDSMPAFLGALILGPAYGAAIGAAGHFLTAATSGFYLSLPVHMIIMAAMGITMYAFGSLYKILIRRNRLAAILFSSAAGIIINGPLALLMIIPIAGKAMLALLPVLTLAALLNVLLAHLIYKFMPESVKTWK